MIKIRIKNADHEIDIRFPIRESELFAKLGEIHAVEGRDAAQSALVTEVYWPEEFSMLKDRFANLDELNYLGKRMESFDTLEYDQFLIGISKLDSKDVKDLINLTFNLNHFTLCQDVSNYGKIGREYVLNTEGAVPAHDEDDPKYATIGKDLIDRGLAQITERGLLIYNPFDELEEVYDGHTFPEYYYNNSLLSLNAEYGGRTELLQLPDEALAIKKAIDRLGAPSAEDCSYTVTFHNFKGNVVIENQDFETLIRHYDRSDAFFYADPPYFSTEDMYEVGFGWDDHVRLRETLGRIKGKFLLSYNDCPEIRELYDGFSLFDFSRTHSMAQRYEAGKEFKELLIANYDYYERENAKPKQLTLFDIYGDENYDYEKILKESIISCKIR